MEFIRNYIGWIFESQKHKTRMLSLDEIKKIIAESPVEQRTQTRNEFPVKTTFAEALEIVNSLQRVPISDSENSFINYSSPFSGWSGREEGEHLLLPDGYILNLTLDIKWRAGKKYPYGLYINYHANFEDDSSGDGSEKRARLGNRFRSFRTYEQGISKENSVTLDLVCSDFYENTYLYYYSSCLDWQMSNKII